MGEVTLEEGVHQMFDVQFLGVLQYDKFVCFVFRQRVFLTLTQLR